MVQGKETEVVIRHSHARRMTGKQVDSIEADLISNMRHIIKQETKDGKYGFFIEYDEATLCNK